jgi:hypothetical protein
MGLFNANDPGSHMLTEYREHGTPVRAVRVMPPLSDTGLPVARIIYDVSFSVLGSAIKTEQGEELLTIERNTILVG